MVKRRKQGLRVTCYFTDADEDTVDSIMDAIEEGRLKNADGRPYKSFSEFIRQAMYDKLERSRCDETE